MADILICYASRTGRTKNIALTLKELFEKKGHSVDCIDCKQISDAKELEKYSALILGSATYHGNMMKPMETFLFLCEKANLKGKIGGAFGSYGWSGEAPQRIHDTMESVFGMVMPAQPLKIKAPVKKVEVAAIPFVEMIDEEIK